MLHEDVVIQRTNLETWVFDLLKDIHTAAEKGENYDLHLEPPAVDEIAKEFEHASWIEIY